MNLPNALTILRFLLVPVFMVFMLLNELPYANIICAAIFVLAFFTDWLDGFLARKNNQVTNFGKIMDPLADKVLVTAALVCLNVSSVVSAWVTVIILAREFIVSGIRISAASEGNVIAASMWGKAKTMWQFIALTLAILIGKNLYIDICIWLAAALTIVSGIDYLMKNGKYLSLK
ncbi:MAG: CDP-diacylglycerol--glycerol-3-phosphate 3-phosphatidyltransferase [Ruminococcaceae bacterium]|nr:CDP-diacylglycerol--glycerol-3-phosphate 3-phosphatidyltransferase [Oscillospiraceae bacterium]